MCGIAGTLNYNLNHPVDLGTVSTMLASIQYRGPDESGIYLGENVGLGSVRLSIIDLKTGQQPISNHDETLWIVFNGEVFNYIELRDELIKKGYSFKTTTDTEVVLKLYEEFGPDCLNKLNGQFAFSIWNTRTKELFLARDRVGIRPLFYSETSEAFIFGSEIKALLQHPTLQPEISPKSLSQIFTFWTSLTPNTAFKGIFELPPGHFMIVNSTGKNIKPYWKLPFENMIGKQVDNLENALEEFHELFTDAVRIRLRADVPVGAYLSGGIDSSITTKYIQSIFPDILRTFSIGFTEKEFDESRYQQLAVDQLKTSHSSIQCNSIEIADRFPDVVWHTETPILRTAPTPMFLLSKLVRKSNYKVVITGEGADEMFGGYNIFKESMIRRFWAREPQSKFRPLLLQRLYPYIPQMKDSNSNMLKFFFGYKLSDTDSPFYSHLLRWNNTSRIRNHFSDQFKAETKDYDTIEDVKNLLPENFKKFDDLSKAQWLESSIFMSGYLLSSQGDRMAMAHSVEGRYPFLDHRIIEFAARLPEKFKLNGLTEKYLLKKLMKGKLPEEIVNRSKQAYRAPIQSSFVSNSPGYMEDLISTDQLRAAGIFNPESVQALFKNMKAGNRVSEIDNMALTGIISTQLLYEQFVKGERLTKTGEKPVNCKVIRR